jgi:cytochrome c553
MRAFVTLLLTHYRTPAVLGGLVLLLGCIAFATDPYYRPVVVAPVKVQVPLYGAGYTQAAVEGGGFAEADRSTLRRIEDKLDRVLRIAEAAEGQQPEQPPAKPAEPAQGEADPAKALRAAAGKCVACHHVDKFEKSGGGFQLFGADGSFAKLSDRDRRKVAQMVESGQMPPEGRPPLSAEEKSALAGQFK